MADASTSRIRVTDGVGAAPVDRYECTYVVSPDPAKGDFTALQPAINALPASGGKIFVKAGVYPLTSTIQITGSNIHIQGEGIGATVFVAAASMTDKPALEIFNSAFGQLSALAADANRGAMTVQIPPAEAASFAAGNYVLLYSDKSVDTEEPAKHAGEVKQIIAVDAASGVITTDDQVFDTYTLADSAQLVRVSMLQNITLSDFSVTFNPTASTLTVGSTHFRFVEDLQIQRLEVHDAYNSGIHLQSTRNASISDCYIHHIRDVSPPHNERYGIVVGGASQNVSITGSRFSHTRHAVTTGGSSGKFQNGVQRNIVVANCTSMLTDTAHFDTHQPAENVTFIGCAAIGGVPAESEAYGFQMRARNGSIIGCSVLQAVGRGIMLFGPVSGGASVTGNMIANVKAINGRAGTGIYFDSAGTSNHAIVGNVIKNCEGSAVANGGSNNDVVIAGNVIENVNTAVPGAAIQLLNAARVLISANNIATNGAVPAIDITGTSAASAILIDNIGYNPVGKIANPWPASGGDLTNIVSGGGPNPQSAAVYTVRQSPKTIVVNGGRISDISVNGAATGAKNGAFKLGIGETIAITYTMAPATTVFAE